MFAQVAPPDDDPLLPILSLVVGLREADGLVLRAGGCLGDDIVSTTSTPEA